MPERRRIGKACRRRIRRSTVSIFTVRCTDIGAHWVVAISLLCATIAPCRAHDTITADQAASFGTSVAALQRSMDGPGDTAQRADAAYRLGLLLDEVAVLLSDDWLAHAGSHSVIAELLLADIQTHGVTLEMSPSTQRYQVDPTPFETYLALRPDGDHAADIHYNLITTWFYDRPIAADAGRSNWNLRVARADSVAAFSARFPNYGDDARREEIAFIAAATAFEAARDAPDDVDAGRYLLRAETALEAFSRNYPQSLRAAAVGLMQDALLSTP